MITKEVFIDTLKVYKSGVDFLRKMDDEGLDLYETPLTRSADALFDAWLNQITNDDGVDLIYWWLFEDTEKELYDDDQNVIAKLTDETTLYDYMNENGYF